jgi:hypothetical protein
LEVRAGVPVQVQAGVLVQVRAAVPLEVRAEVPVEVPLEVPADVPADVGTGATAAAGSTRFIGATTTATPRATPRAISRPACRPACRPARRAPGRHRDWPSARQPDLQPGWRAVGGGRVGCMATVLAGSAPVDGLRRPAVDVGPAAPRISAVSARARRLPAAARPTSRLRTSAHRCTRALPDGGRFVRSQGSARATGPRRPPGRQPDRRPGCTGLAS